MKVDEQKLANKCGRLVQTGAVSASPRPRSCLFALRPRRHNLIDSLEPSPPTTTPRTFAIRTHNKRYVVQVTGGRSAVLLGNGSIIFDRRPRETGIREL